MCPKRLFEAKNGEIKHSIDDWLIANWIEISKEKVLFERQTAIVWKKLRPMGWTATESLIYQMMDSNSSRKMHKNI